MTIRNLLDDVADIAQNLSWRLKDLERELNNTELGSEVRDEFHGIFDDLGTELAVALGLPFPNHWHETDHPVLAVIADYQKDYCVNT